MKLCGQCGESYSIGGFASVPDRPIFEKERCLNCIMWEVRQYNKAAGTETKNCLLIKPADDGGKDVA